MQAAPAQEHVDAEDHERDQQRGEHRARQVAELRAVEAEAHDGQALDNDHEVRAVVAEHARQQQRIAVKAVAGHQKRHQCAERSDEEAEAHQRTAAPQHGDGNEDHVDVAQMQRQLAPPVEAAHVGCDDVVIRVDREEILVEKEADKGHETGADEHRALCLAAFAPQQQACENEKGEEGPEHDEKERVEGPHDPEAVFTLHGRYLRKRMGLPRAGRALPGS